MCKKKQTNYCPSKIDECIKPWIMLLEDMGWNIVACCCGHEKYSTTVVIKNEDINNGMPYELFTEKDIPRKRKFYKKDKQGYYFIPEVENE